MAPDLDFLAIGHVSLDLTERGPAVGGSALYQALTAAALGRRAALLTRGAPVEAAPLLERLAAVVDLPSSITTTFRMSYRDGVRLQTLRRAADSIGPEDLPTGWERIPTVVLAPVYHDVDPALAERFPRSLLGAAPQGWLRTVDANGVVIPGGEIPQAVLRRADVIVASELDLAGRRVPVRWLHSAGTLILTLGGRGALLRRCGAWFRVPAYPAREVDPTGAGDVFAAAYLIRYAETGDAPASGLFAAGAASFAIEAAGVSGIPAREQALRRMEENPGLRITEVAESPAQVAE